VLATKLLAVVDELRAPAAHRERLMVRASGRVAFVETEQIDWIEAEGNYVRLHVGAESYVMRETMVSIAARLNADRFFRIHRSRIVRVDRIKELRVAAGGDYDVVLYSGLRLGLSRLYKDALQVRLTKGR
jgi:two-component system LytT family response regulator